MIVTNAAGRRFFVHVVFQGEAWGLNKCLVNEKEDPLIEFYDFTHAGPRFTPRGQFVSNYYAATLAKSTGGINLQGGIPEWGIDAEALRPVLELARLITK